jgi:hypothetical protein
MRVVLRAEVEHNDMVRTKTEAILVDALAAKAHLVAVSRFVCACEYHTSLPPLTRCQSSSGRCFSLRLCL